MTCREFADFMADYLSQELSADARALFERHLSRCEACRAYLADYQATIRIGRQAFEAAEDELPRAVPQDLVDAILAARKR